MFYIFNKDNNCIASCDFEPNIEDLETRNEIYIKNETIYTISEITLKDNKITKKEIKSPTKEEIKQQKLINLDLEYQPKFLEITRSWSNADMDNNTELMNKLIEEKKKLIEEYNIKREVILNE